MNAVWPNPAGQALVTPPLVADVLDEYGTAVRRAMAAHVDHASRAPFLGELIADHLDRPGKMMRPAICIATARAFGADLDDALSCAVAIELFHNAVLIHDDIEDDSETRRGQPTLHSRHGVPLALNAGDAMMLMALRPLFDGMRGIQPSVASAILHQTRTMAQETVEGQALDLGWRDRNADVAETDYLSMVMKKTAWMAVIWPLQVGALIGARGRIDPETLVRAGFFLGAAFQIQDDLLNLVADHRYGKEKLGDLYEGKRTLMLIHARRMCTAAERVRLDAFLACGRPQRTPGTVAWVAALMERYGSDRYAHAFASALAGAAQAELTLALGQLPPSRDKDFLLALPSWVFERT